MSKHAHTQPPQSVDHGHGEPVAWDPGAPRRRNAVRLLALGALLAALGGWMWWRGIQAKRNAVVRPEHPELLSGDLKAMVDAQIAALEEDAYDARKHGILGLTYEANRLWPESRASYAKAAELDPNDPNWPYHAALAKYYVDGDLQGVMKELTAVTERFPNYPPAQYRLGDFLLDSGDLDGAQRAFTQTIAGAPRAADGYIGLGEVLLRKDDLDGAAKQLTQAITLEPNYKRAHYLLGRVLQKQGQTERAQQELALGSNDAKRAMLDPVGEHIAEYTANIDVQLSRASELLNARRLPEAAALLEQISSLHPDNVTALMTLGVVQLQQNQPAQALEALQRAETLAPRDPKVKVNLAACYLVLHRAAEARACAERALELEPGLMQAQMSLVQAHMMAGDAEAALVPMRRAVELAPNDPDLLGRLVLIEKQTKRFADARMHSERLSELTPERWEPWADLVEFNVELGEFDAAQNALDNVRRLAPDEKSLPHLTQLLEERRKK